MNYNLKRHKLLKELSKLIINIDENKAHKDCNKVSMTFKQIDKFLNITRQEREIILSDLWNSKEIILCEIPNDSKSCYINNPIGISSFSNKKYVKKNEDIFIKWLKNFVQIFIPIASLTITIIILLINPKNNYDKLNVELQTIKLKLEYIEKFQNKKEHNPILEIHKNE